MPDTILLSQGELQAQISTLGAELTSLRRENDEYLWQSDPTFWARHAPVLFPIVGTLRNNQAQSSNGICKMSRHGFARDAEFTLVAQDSNRVDLRLDSNAKTFALYPYHFRLSLSYSLEDSCGKGTDTLRQSFVVTNTGNSDMFFSLGGHPAFNIPAPRQGGSWEDYELIFSQPWSCDSPVVTEEGLWDYSLKVPIIHHTDRLLLRRSLFAHDTIELEQTPDSTVTLASKISGNVLRIDFRGFYHLGIWSAGGSSGKAPFLAIEPWCGTATRTDEDDIFEHKQDMLMAAAGKSVTRSFSITLL